MSEWLDASVACRDAFVVYRDAPWGSTARRAAGRLFDEACARLDALDGELGVTP